MMADPLTSIDALYEFEYQRRQNTSAFTFWSGLPAPLRSVEFLVDLLIIEDQHSPKDELPTERWNQALHLLTTLGGGFQQLSQFMSNLFQQRVDKGMSLAALESLELEPSLFRSLKAEGDPFHLFQDIGNRILIRQRLGHGSFGVAYRAIDGKTGQQVACKAARNDSRTRQETGQRLLHRELDVLRTLRGKGVPGNPSLHYHDATPVLIMDYVEGETLDELIGRSPLSPAHAATLFLELLGSLEFAHEHRILHRDLKPENIMVSRAGKPIIIDFGLMLHCDQRQLQEAGKFAGTPGYAPADAILGFADELDDRCDIYAIGIMLHEVVTGIAPSKNESKEDSFVESVTASTVGLHWPQELEIPIEFQRIALRCVEANPLHRYHGVKPLAQDLRRFLESGSAS